jgi:putative MFS transporter
MEGAQNRPSAAARLDRLPIGLFHKRMTWALGYVFFFELGDIYTFAYAAPALMKSWHLDISTISFITSATFIGMFVGATVGGWVSDIAGRKRALVLSALWYSGFSLLNALVAGPRGLFIARLMTGVGLSGMTVIGITYISEMYPASKRGTFQGYIMTVGLIGVPVNAFVARTVIPMASWGWRVVFIWGSLGVLFPLFSRWLEESPKWYENQGRFEEADAVLDRIEAQLIRQKGALPPVPPAAVKPAPRKAGPGELFSRQNLPTTLMLSVTWIGQTLGFHGFTAWVPTLLVARGFGLVRSLGWSFAMSIGTIPGALLAAFIADRFERKRSIPVIALVVASCGLLYGKATTPWAIVTFGFLVEASLRMFASVLYTYTPECFPAEVRNSGSGLVYGVGRLANIVGPLIVAYLFTQYGITSVFVYIAASWVVVALAVGLFGPATGLRPQSPLALEVQPPVRARAGQPAVGSPR